MIILGLNYNKQSVLFWLSKKGTVILLKFLICKGNSKAIFENYNKVVGNSSENPTQILPDLDECDGDSFKLASSFNHFFIEKVQRARDHIHNELNSVEQPVHAFNGKETNNHSLDHSSILTDFKPSDMDELINLIREQGIRSSSKIDPISSSTMKECLDPLLPHLLDLINTSFSNIISGNTMNTPKLQLYHYFYYYTG